MDLSLPAANASTKQIGDLADADLEEIFKRLSPFDRFIVSEVCRRWHGLSRKAWRDVTHLDLGPIPGKRIGAILGLCPNLRSVFAVNKSFCQNELACPSRLSQLSTVKLFDCKFVVEGKMHVINYVFAQIFSENLQPSSWNELVLHDAHIEDMTFAWGRTHCWYPIKWVLFADNRRASLTRLQLSGLRINHIYDSLPERFPLDDLFRIPLDRLQNLECFIFHASLDKAHHCGLTELTQKRLIYRYVVGKIYNLKNLRELCISVGPTKFYTYNLDLGRLTSCLPRLEVLFLKDVDGEDTEDDLKDLVVNNSVLRILVLSGGFHRWYDPIELPLRKRFPNGFGSDPLPLLHIFVGKQASERIRFAKSASDALIVHPINEPMPQFLERADIAPIFEGVWIAEKIKETARNGGKLWNYELCDTANSIQNT